jgi:hypothetical protein
MWEVEALIEEAVKLIDKSEFSVSEKRNLIWNAYEVQGYFDCSFTHFRVIEILIKYEYVQQYEVNVFPLAKKHPEYFEGLTKKKFEWINQIPTEKWSGDENPSIAYWNQKYNSIFVDFGTEYYTIHPKDKELKYEPLAFAKLIIEEGSRQKNRDIVYDWSAFMLFYLMPYFASEESIDVLKTNYFVEVRKHFKNFDYADYKALHEGLDLNYDIEYIENNEWLLEQQKELFKYLNS